VRVLQEIAIGVDQVLMGRIGALFPNLTTIRTLIEGDGEGELLLISIWKCCLNLTDLFITLTPDDGCGWDNDSLDSIFSGIPEDERQCWQKLAVSRGPAWLAKLKSGSPSVCQLKSKNPIR
jgi:hypothetical protein